MEAPSVEKTQKGYAVQRIHPFLGAEGKVGLEQEAGFLPFQGEPVEFFRVRKWPFIMILPVSFFLVNSVNTTHSQTELTH